MAMVIPIILIFLLVIVDFGFVFDRHELIQHAVREGARSAAVGTDVGTVTTNTYEQSGKTLTNITVCYVDDNTSNPVGGAGDSVRVRGESTYNLLVGSGGFVSLPGIHMAPSSQARLEKTVPGATAC